MPPPAKVSAKPSLGAVRCFSTWSNQANAADSATSVPLPVSCPPRRHSTDTGVPCAAMPRALASASLSGNSESCSPWVSSVGASMRLSTPAGLDWSSRVRIDGSGSLPWARFW